MTDRPTDAPPITGIVPQALHAITGYARRRYPMQIDGFDLDGRPRCLVLTWDGVWHPASPTTGNILKMAHHFMVDQRGRYDGEILVRTGAHRPGDLINKTVWEREDGTTVDIYAHVLVEVLP